MRLFLALCRRKHMPPGHIYKGKTRIVKEVTWADRRGLLNDYALEEKNMFYLRHPFLTLEQSSGHTRDLGKREERFIKLRSKEKEFRDNVTVESRLGHLRHKEPWE